MAESIAHLQQNFNVVSGRTKRLKFELKDTDENGIETGPLDLTGRVLKFKVRNPETGETVEKTVGSGITVDSPATAGVCRVVLTSTDTASMTVKGLLWELYFDETGGENDDPLAGGQIIPLLLAL